MEPSLCATCDPDYVLGGRQVGTGVWKVQDKTIKLSLKAALGQGSRECTRYLPGSSIKLLKGTASYSRMSVILQLCRYQVDIQGLMQSLEESVLFLLRALIAQ